MNFIKTLTLLTLCCVCVQASAKTYIVSPMGSDADEGTKQRPFKTISQGALVAQAGDTVLVLEGIYRERVSPSAGGLKGAPIVYMAEPGKRVFIKGSDLYTASWGNVAKGIYAAELGKMNFSDDVYWDSPNPFKVAVSSTPWSRDGAPEGDKNIVFTLGQVFVQGQMYRQYPLKTEMESEQGSWWYDASSNRVLVNFMSDHSPKMSNVEITTRRRIFAPHKRGLGYIHVIGFVMEHCGNQFPRNFWTVRENSQAGALSLRSGHHWLIKGNVVRYAANIGIDCGVEGPDNERTGQPSLVGRDVLSNRIEQNYVVDNGCTGIIGYCSKDLQIKDNVVMYNNNQHYRGHKRYEQGGIKLHDNTDCIVSGNYVVDNFTYGVWFDNQYFRARISNNIIARNHRSGVFLEMADYDFGAVLIDFNVIMDNVENQVYMHDASGALFVNNLIAGTKAIEESDSNVHTGVKRSEKYGQGVYIRQVGPRTKSYHNAFYNNIFCGNDITYDINYPQWRGGEQRFLGNLYDMSVMDKRMLINNTPDSPSPFTADKLRQRVASDMGADVSIFTHEGSKADMNMGQWQRFWNGHSMHWDSDAQIMDGLYALFQPETQSVHLGITAQVAPRANSRWNQNYKHTYNMTQNNSVPGPFQNLTTGSNNYFPYRGLPPIERGELPSIESFNKLQLMISTSNN